MPNPLPVSAEQASVYAGVHLPEHPPTLFQKNGAAPTKREPEQGQRKPAPVFPPGPDRQGPAPHRADVTHCRAGWKRHRPPVCITNVLVSIVPELRAIKRDRPLRLKCRRLRAVLTPLSASGLQGSQRWGVGATSGCSPYPVRTVASQEEPVALAEATDRA